MKKTTLVVLQAVAVLLLITLNQCKKENKNLPKACMVADNDRVSAGTEVTFSNCTVGGVTYQWNFGDGQASTATSPTHTFAAIGEYTVTLTATNSDGSATTTKVIRVIGCDPGYEGANCATETRAKFIGSYSASENGSVTGAANFSLTIVNNPTDVTKIRITNFWDNFVNPVNAVVSGNSITIPSQIPDNDGYAVSGTGTINGTTITITYVVVNQGLTDNVTGTWSRQ